jgi:hypothetical protein
MKDEDIITFAMMPLKISVDVLALGGLLDMSFISFVFIR